MFTQVWSPVLSVSARGRVWSPVLSVSAGGRVWSPVLSVSPRGRVWSPVLSVSDAGEGTSLSLHAGATGWGTSGAGPGPTWSGRAAPDSGTGRDGQDGLWNARPGRRVPPHDGWGATAPLIRARVRGKPGFGSLISRLW